MALTLGLVTFSFYLARSFKLSKSSKPSCSSLEDKVASQACAQDGYVKPGDVVEIDADLLAFICSDMIQSARPADRVDRAQHLDEAMFAMLCSDLSFCPDGLTFEIKPKVGIADCGVPECGIPDVPRFTMLQCIDYPRKKKSLSRYNPVRFFRAVLHRNKLQLREELGFLRDASRDQSQNNFRVLGGAADAYLVPDASLDDLCEVQVPSLLTIYNRFLKRELRVDHRK